MFSNLVIDGKKEFLTKLNKAGIIEDITLDSPFPDKLEKQKQEKHVIISSGEEKC
jgi:hypothetical protein